MKSFDGKLAVVTGGGTGMGRELARQLAAAGCQVAICDVSDDNMQQTRELCEADSPAGIRISTHLCDVSDEQQVLAFRTSVVNAHDAKHLNLLFNNAGIGGGGTITDPNVREEWDKTFNVCWYGVYYCTLAFMPLLKASEEAHLINTSSVNGFWASLGPTSSHSAYSAAKFAVKGFTEALVNDFRNNAPHIKASVVMPGHIGTDIVINSNRMLGRDPKEMSDDQLEEARERLVGFGLPVENVTSEQLRQALVMLGEGFRNNAPMTAAEAASVILDGVRTEQWRILVGKDAQVLDRLVREAPEEAYEEAFMEKLRKEANWGLGV